MARFLLLAPPPCLPFPHGASAALCNRWEPLGAQKPPAQDQMLMAMFYLQYDANIIVAFCR